MQWNISSYGSVEWCLVLLLFDADFVRCSVVLCSVLFMSITHFSLADFIFTSVSPVAHFENWINSNWELLYLLVEKMPNKMK